MKALLVTLLLAHGLIHFLGAAKAFGVADLPQLTQPVSRGAGIAWLAAGLAMVTAAVRLVTVPRVWWVVGLAAVMLSQATILSAWSDAKFGTVVNVIVLAAVAYGFASGGPLSFRAQYEREVRARLADSVSPEPVTEADIEHLPPAVQRYLRATGAVGQPRVHHSRARWSGRIREGPEDPWMEFTANQHNFVDEPARFFHLTARRSGLPVDVLHAYQEGVATMRVRLLSLFPIVDAIGPEMRQAETVTVLNDLCLFAPGALIDARIRWEEIDAYTVRAMYTVAPHTISATLTFNDTGKLVNFVSDDRIASPDGEKFERWRWSTPVLEYRTFGPLRVTGRGEGRWHPPEGDFAYIELELLDLEINGTMP
ncbi:MAG TPA: DUF6544 family protein [Longimicrobiales bacterium]|nr:DUF6544 family protein [Longimicrobiales bacterium]